jgi:hypothetical protein
MRYLIKYLQQKIINSVFISISALLVLTHFSYIVNAQPSVSQIPVISEKQILQQVKSGYKLEIHVPEHLRNMSAYMGVSAQVANTGNKMFRLEGYVNNQRWTNGVVHVYPGEIKTLEILFKRLLDRGTKDFPAMNGIPGGSLWLWSARESHPDSIKMCHLLCFLKGKVH